MTNGQRSCALLLAALAGACDGPSAPTPAPASAVPDFSRLVTDERLQSAANEPDNWLTHGRTYLEQRHSPLTAINKDTLSRLAPAWYYEFDTYRGQEATPLVADADRYFDPPFCAGGSGA